MMFVEDVVLQCGGNEPLRSPGKRHHADIYYFQLMANAASVIK
jgi:hypothetical protein